MNRNKVILLLTAFETMLLVILCMLYFNGTIGMRLFVGVVLTLSILCSALVVVILRKFKN
jgi:hypothetical protein